MKTAVIYARYSSDAQTEQSIEGQLRVCEEYAARNDIIILHTYIDRAMTGTNDLRPDFQKMLKDSAKKEWDYVLVYKLDRFSRDKYETAVHKRTLKNNGVKVLSAMENIPDGPEGIILEALLEGMSQYYSAELSQKVKRGMRENRRKGLFQGGGVLYGYKVEDHRLQIDEEKAEVVRFIYEQYAAGVYVKDIITELTARGILYHNAPFAKSTVYRILQSDKYTGVYYHEDERVDNMYPQIIPFALFEKVRIKGRINQRGKSSSRAIYLLRNRMICGYCGHHVNADTGTAKNGDVARYYKCYGRKENQNGCQLKMRRKEVLEEAIVEAIIRELSRPEELDRLISTLLDIQEKHFGENIRLKHLEREKEKTADAIRNLVSVMESGMATHATVKRLQELEEQAASLERQIYLEKCKISEKVPEEKMRAFYIEALKKEARLIIDNLVSKVVLYNDKVEIYLTTPLREGPGESQGLSFAFGYVNCFGTEALPVEFFI